MMPGCPACVARGGDCGNHPPLTKGQLEARCSYCEKVAVRFLQIEGFPAVCADHDPDRGRHPYVDDHAFKGDGDRCSRCGMAIDLHMVRQDDSKAHTAAQNHTVATEHPGHYPEELSGSSKCPGCTFERGLRMGAEAERARIIAEAGPVLNPTQFAAALHDLWTDLQGPVVVRGTADFERAFGRSSRDDKADQ